VLCRSPQGEKPALKVHLESTPRWSPNLTAPALVVAVWCGLVLTGQVVQAVTGREVVLCWFHRVTGVACPTCGGTRMAAAIMSGDWATAAVMNPLLLVLLFWLFVWATLRFTCGRRIAIRLHPRWRRIGWSLLAAALVANWLYLIAAGR